MHASRQHHASIQATAARRIDDARPRIHRARGARKPPRARTPEWTARFCRDHGEDVNDDIESGPDAAPLPDGVYDAFIVWAEERDGHMALSLTLITGPDKGAVIDVISEAPAGRDPITLVGLPCTLSVVDGVPRVGT